MAGVKWTNEQLNAITRRNSSLLVAAAAGSGKTAVLVERIIRRILDPDENVDIDRLVIVTFTEAAASQMRERIAKTISDKINDLTKEDVELKKRLKRQLTLLNNATIATMHSFCLKIIKKNFNKINIDPNFRIMDAAEASILKSETAEKIINEKFESEEIDEEFEKIAEIYGTVDGGNGLKNIILSIYDFASSAPFPQKWLECQLEKLKQDKIYPNLKALCDVVMYFSNEYDEVKRKKRCIDYDDLEHFALHILEENPDISDWMTGHYIEIYTDEYQDTNMTQETILSYITKKEPDDSNLFMVGDVKQSIYGFRQARPDIFINKYNNFSKGLIKLYKNFRSRKDIIGSVNYIFSSIMTKDICKLDYNKDEYLYYGANYPEPEWDVSCELLLTDSKDILQEQYADIDMKKVQIEASMIANRIVELIKDSSNGIDYKDIVILLRATKDRAEVFKETFANLKIPAFCDVNMGFYQSKEVKFIISMLRIIDNPIQDIPLLAALKSTVGGFDDDDIVRLRLIDKESGLYQNLLRLASEWDKARDFVTVLSDIRRQAADVSLSELILKIYKITDYFNCAGIFEDGNRRQANLRKLYEEAVRYEEQSGGSIFDFLNYVDKIRQSSGDTGGAAVLGENDNVVRIMSIHKSKGLEFPVVFIANMDKKLNQKDLSQSIIMHPELGFGADYYDFDLRIKYETQTKIAIKEELNNELIAEEMRLLYVAMTRAKEKLIITGTIPGMEKTMEKYWNVLQDEQNADGNLPSEYILNAKSYFDLIMPVLIRHPDLGLLRNEIEEAQCGGLIEPCEDEECEFKIRIYNKNDIFQMYENTEISDDENDNNDLKNEAEESLCEEDNFLADEIRRRLTYKYKYTHYVDLPVKISVSDIKKSGISVQLIKTPEFLKDTKRVTEKNAAELGTAVHYILQHIDLKNINGQEIERLCVKRGLTSGDMKNINSKVILDFFAGDIGKRMLASSNIYREVPFTMAVTASEIYDVFNDGEEAGEKILVQGIIDCYFEEAGELVLLDYKTDKIEKGGAEIYAQKYKTQLDMYSKALEYETGLKVKEKIVCFLNFHEHYCFKDTGVIE